MTTPDTLELRRKAEAATPGEWRVAEDNNPFADGRHVFAKGLDGSDFVVLNLKTDHTFVTATSREQQQRNALFAAAANPAVILALLDRLDALEGREAWQHPSTLPHPKDAGLFWGALRVGGINSPLEWEVHILSLDDETHEIHPHFYAGWRWEDYEFWKPCAIPEAPTTLADEGRDQ